MALDLSLLIICLSEFMCQLVIATWKQKHPTDMYNYIKQCCHVIMGVLVEETAK